MVEILGYLGSAVVIGSLSMRSIRRLRLLGLLGSLTFVAYGIGLGAWPLAATNCVTASVHLYHLWSLAHPPRVPVVERPGPVLSPILVAS